MHFPSLFQPLPKERFVDATAERKASLLLGDVGCPGCLRRARAALLRVPGVRRVSFGALRDRVAVHHDGRRAEAPGLVEALVGAMRAGGFRVERATETTPARGERRRALALAVSAGALITLSAFSGLGLADEAGLAPAKRDALRAILALAAVIGALAALRTGALRPPRSLMARVALLGALILGLVEIVTGEGPRVGLEAAAFLAVWRAVLERASEHARRSAREIAGSRGAGAEEPLPGPGERVVVAAGDQAPADLWLETPARALFSGHRGPSGMRSTAPADLLPAGAVALEPGAIGRVARPARAALEAEVSRALERVDSLADLGPDEARPGEGWEAAADQSLAAATGVLAIFAVATHTALGASAGDTLGGAARVGLASALAVLALGATAAPGLGGPAARAVAVLRAGAMGLLVKDPRALEALGAATTVVLDRSGVLTTGEAQVASVTLAEGASPALLEAARAIEEVSAHPSARAVAAFLGGHLESLGVVPAALGAGAAVSDGAFGVAGRASGRVVAVVPAARLSPGSHASGASALVLDRGMVAATLALREPPRPSAPAVAAALEARGFAVKIVSGATASALLEVAAPAGLTGTAGLDRLGKALVIKGLQVAGARVAHVGDGWRGDATGAAADVAIAIAPGALPGATAAPLVITGARLWGLVELVDLGRALGRARAAGMALGLSALAVLVPVATVGCLPAPAAAAIGGSVALLTALASTRLLARTAPPR